MLTCIDYESVDGEQFKGSKGLGRGPDTLDWVSIASRKRGSLTPNTSSKKIDATGGTPLESHQPKIHDNDSPPKRNDTDTMTDITDYRQELKLRDDQLRREMALRQDSFRAEMDLRQESFRAEQAVRDKALDEKFSGFFRAQAERDKAWEKISEARFERIEKDVGSIKTDAKKVADDVNGIKVTMAKYLGAAVVIGALASAALGAAAKHLLN